MDFIELGFALADEVDFITKTVCSILNSYNI